jgi:Bacterial Ig-like domain
MPTILKLRSAYMSCYMAIGLIVLAPASEATAERANDFCAPREIGRNYERPFLRLPELHQMPETRLPFAPPALHVERILGVDRYGIPRTYQVSQVLVGDESYGYAFSNENPRRALRLDWKIRARLQKTDHLGGPSGPVASKGLSVSRIHPKTERHLIFDVPSKPGIYRISIELGDRRGQILGRYSEYLRVLRPRVKARLTVEDHSVLAGEAVFSRIENLATASIEGAAGFDVQRFDGSTWVSVPVDQGWEPYGSYARVGWSSNCAAVFEVPPDSQRGRYRIVKEVWPQGRRGRSFSLSAEFEVTS